MTPATVTLAVVAAVAAAVAARNMQGLLDVDARTGTHVVMIGYGWRIACLQMATMLGLVIVASSAATQVGLGSQQGDELLAILEPSAWRRWLLRWLSLMLAALATLVLCAATIDLAGLVQARRLGSVRVVAGESNVLSLAGHTLVVLATFAAIAVLVAALLRSNPAIAAGVLVATAWAALLLQHLLGGLGDRVVPTAWVARWMHLPEVEYGSGYVWTTGAFEGGGLVAGAGLAALTVAASAVGLLIIARAGRA